MQPPPPFGHEQIFTEIIRGVLDTVTAKPAVSAERSAAAKQTAVCSVMAFIPRDPVETMLAGQCVVYDHMLRDGAKDLLEGKPEEFTIRARPGVLATGKMFLGTLGMLLRMQRRPDAQLAFGRPLPQPVAEPETQPTEPQAVPAEPLRTAAHQNAPSAEAVGPVQTVVQPRSSSPPPTARTPQAAAVPSATAPTAKAAGAPALAATAPAQVPAVPAQTSEVRHADAPDAAAVRKALEAMLAGPHAASSTTVNRGFTRRPPPRSFARRGIRNKRGFRSG